MFQHSCILAHSFQFSLHTCIAYLRNSLRHLHSCISSLEPPIAWFNSKKHVSKAQLRAFILESYLLALYGQGALSQHPSIPNSWNCLDRRVQSGSLFYCTFFAPTAGLESSFQLHLLSFLIFDFLQQHIRSNHVVFQSSNFDFKANP